MPEPWLKLDTGLTSNPKAMALPADVFKAWICCMVEAKRYNAGGRLPAVARLAFTLHIPAPRMEQMVAVLIEARLIDREGDELVMHDWQDWQHQKPSARPEAVRERVARHRDNVTPRNTPNGVTKDVTPCNTRNATRLEKSRQEERREEGESPPVTPPRSRGSRITASFPLSDEIVTYAVGLGIDRESLEAWHENFVDYWVQRPTKATSLDWVRREKTRIAADVRDGRLKRSQSPAQRAPATPPSRAQEPEAPILTPAEASYAEMRHVVDGSWRAEVISADTARVVAVLGGWEQVARAPPGFPEWLPAWMEVRNASGD